VNTHRFCTSAFLTLCFVLSAIDGKIDQHVCIKFCMKLGKYATETLEMLREAFGEHSLCLTAVFEWHSHFKVCQVSVENDECSGRPSTSKTTENVENCHQTIRELADTVGISYGVRQEILTENLNMPHIAAMFVPQLLTNDQKQRRINVCLEL
jgi:hypothetical protein